MAVTSNVPNELKKENWLQDHLNFKHKGIFYTWCPLCMKKQEGEKNNVKNNDLGIDVTDKIKPKAVFGA